MLYTIKEVAATLKVHHMTVRRWIDEGKLESSRVGKGIRVTEEQLQNFIKKNSGVE